MKKKMLRTLPKDTSDAHGQANAKIIRDFSARFNQILDAAKVPPLTFGRPAALAERFGVAPQTASRWCSGEALPSPMLLIEISRQFRCSVDWLIGNAEQVGLAANQTDVAMYRLAPDAATAVDKAFSRQGALIVERVDAYPGQRCLVENWTDLDDPPFLRGDLLMLDMATSAFSEQDCYVLRTGPLYAVRRVCVTLDGAIVVSRTTPAGTESVTHALADFAFNSTQRFEAKPPAGKTLVVGRILHYTRSVVSGVPRFGRL